MGKTFICDECGGEFPFVEEKEPEAQAEFAKNFPGMDIGDAGIVCDGCYPQIMERVKAGQN